MTGADIHDWVLGYLSVAIAFALMMAVSTEHRRSADAPAGAVRVALVTIGGALWPVLAVGVGQLAVLTILARRWGPGRRATVGPADQSSALRTAHRRDRGG